ncbi:MAG: CocE/NonD family hydrolase [Chloroflexota bacterium]
MKQFDRVRSSSSKPFWRQLLARLLKLPPIENGVVVHRDIAIPMSDGEILYADHFAPKSDATYPTILIRSPWGRSWGGAPFSLLYRYVAHRFAERGFHLLLQDTHKRPWRNSDHPMSLSHEVKDGRDTLDWLATQPWFNGELGLWGASYLGYVQWAALAAEVPELKKVAVFPVTTATNWSTVLHPDGIPAVDTLFRLQYLTGMPDGSIFKRIKHLNQQETAITNATNQTPLISAAHSLPIADGVNFVKALEECDVQSPFWQAIDLSSTLMKSDAEVCLVAGWYDVFLREQLADYQVLRGAGKQPNLTIGPWHHTDRALGDFVLPESLAWFEGHLREKTERLPTKPVRVFMMGCDEWRELDDWPPPTTSQHIYLCAEQKLSTEPPGSQEEPDRYVYDPAAPTPTIGGAVLSPKAGRQDNRELEERKDILCYTSQVFDADLAIMGEPELVLYVRSTNEHTDFFGRLCDVYPDGRSLNVTDGLIRIKPPDIEPEADGSLRITFRLWPTAYSFAQGNCLRLQVASGAHPRWNRNLGTGEEPLDGVEMASANQTVYHDEDRQSYLKLPVYRASN